MIGKLTPEQIEDLLQSERIGRIGCHAEGRTYVVPVAYAYDRGAVYGHSPDGLKVRTMRANAHMCFEVERVRDLLNWESVIAWGTYEELAGARGKPPNGSAREKVVFLTLRLEEKTGRFERS
jgi:nitroimidazol reductase NimA-like FMN-containing flavoprotein (pyridoxamine 5'-phosphate oxidase superfamily)